MRCSATVALSLFLVTAGACSTGSEEVLRSSTGTERENVNTAEAITRSIEAMADLESYRMEFTFRPEGEELTFLADYSDPNDYYERFLGTLEIPTTFELVLHGDRAYGRQCENYPEVCMPWQEEDERPPVPGAGGLTSVAPETLGLTTLSLIEDGELLGMEDYNGSYAIHLRGSLILGKAILENKRSVYGGIQDYWESCESVEVAGGPAATETCRTLSFEEYAQEEYGERDFDLEPRSPVHLWLSADDFRLHRLVIGQPGTSPDLPTPASTYFEVSYSHFNQVQVEPPNSR